MARTHRQILDERDSALVGRDREIDTLLAAADGRGPLVAIVHGIAGVGKSTVLRAFAARARARGAAVVQLDGSAIEPTERGFLGALADVLAEPVMTVPDAAARFTALDRPAVLVVDTVERLRLLDDWLRQQLLPALPETVRVVLAGRDPPGAAWTSTFGELLAVIALHNLDGAAAERVLRTAGLGEADARRVNRLAHGHPLSLRLAASALAARPDLTLEGATVPAVVDHFTGLFLGGLDPSTRRALDAAAVVRRPTSPLLDAMLGAGEGPEAWARLDALSFTETGPDGLVVHDTVRAAVDAALRAEDPARRRRLRAAAFARLQEEARAARSGDLWRSTADLLFLVDNPLVREGFFPSSASPYAVERAHATDGGAILAITERHQGTEAAATAREWWQTVPEAFSVARDRTGKVAAYMVLCEPRAAGARLIGRDPVAARWRQDLHARPLPPDDRILFVRFLLTRDAGEAPGPAQAALWLDAKRVYMELRPQLRRVYVSVGRREVFDPLLEPLGFVGLPGGPVVHGRDSQHALALDFGPGSVDGWLARLVAMELELDAEPRLDAAGRVLLAGGRRIALTALEFDLLAHLQRHPGRAVPRAELLRDVWGHQVQSDGNVIEVAVSAIRRKTSPQANVIETVRGIGYRWRTG